MNAMGPRGPLPGRCRGMPDGEHRSGRLPGRRNPARIKWAGMLTSFTRFVRRRPQLSAAIAAVIVVLIPPVRDWILLQFSIALDELGRIVLYGALLLLIISVAWRNRPWKRGSSPHK